MGCSRTRTAYLEGRQEREIRPGRGQGELVASDFEGGLSVQLQSILGRQISRAPHLKMG